MAGNEEKIFELQNEIDELKEDIKTKDREIESLNDNNKEMTERVEKMKNAGWDIYQM